MTNHTEPAALVDELAKLVAVYARHGLPSGAQDIAEWAVMNWPVIATTLETHATAIRERDEARALLREAGGWVFAADHDEGCELHPEYGEAEYERNYDAEIEDDIDAEREPWPDGATCLCGKSELTAAIDTLLSDGGEHE